MGIKLSLIKIKKQMLKKLKTEIKIIIVLRSTCREIYEIRTY